MWNKLFQNRLLDFKKDSFTFKELCATVVSCKRLIMNQQHFGVTVTFSTKAMMYDANRLANNYRLLHACSDDLQFLFLLFVQLLYKLSDSMF